MFQAGKQEHFDVQNTSTAQDCSHVSEFSADLDLVNLTARLLNVGLPQDAVRSARAILAQLIHCVIFRLEVSQV